LFESLRSCRVAADMAGREDRRAIGAHCPVHSVVSEECGDIIGDRLALRRDPVWKNANRSPSAPGMSSTIPSWKEDSMPRSRPTAHRRVRAPQLPPELRRVNLNAAGVDVGAASHYVAVPEGRDPEGCDVRAFGAFTADLYALADWLTRCGIETVAMESTGVLDPPLRAPERARLRGQAGRPAAVQERARPENRRPRLPVDPAAAHFRLAVPRLPAR
jgi:hypothetical protein